MQQSLREIRPLTGVRGIAALVVVCLHFFHESATASLAPSMLSKGYLAVDLFFMLSGLVMALNYSASVTWHAGWKKYAQFLYKRLARIYPLYIVVTGLVLVIAIEQLIVKHVALNLDLDLKTLLSNVLLVQTWGVEKNSIVGPAWSISTEWAAYVVFPILIAVTVSSRALIAWCTAALLAAALFLVSHGQAHDTAATSGFLNVWEGDTFYPVLRCLIGFSFGLLGFRLAKLALVRKLLANDWFAILVVAVTFLACFFMLHDVFIYFSLLALALVCYGDSRVANWIFGNPLIYFLGLISYSIYLGHLLVWSYVWKLTRFSQEHLGSMSAIGDHVLPVLALIVLATVLYFSVEKPGQRTMLRMLQPRRPSLPDGAGTASVPMSSAHAVAHTTGTGGQP